MNIAEAKDLARNFPGEYRDAISRDLARTALAHVNGGTPPAMIAMLLLALAVDIWQQTYADTGDLEEVFLSYIESALDQYEEGVTRDEH